MGGNQRADSSGGESFLCDEVHNAEFGIRMSNGFKTLTHHVSITDFSWNRAIETVVSTIEVA